MSNFRKQHMTISWDSLINVESNEAAVNATLQEKSALVGRVGLMMLSVGAGAWRVRAAMNKLSRAMNVICNADIGLLSIEYTCIYQNQFLTNAISINTIGVNTQKLTELRKFTEIFSKNADKYCIRQFFELLDDIEYLVSHYNALKLGFASAFACAAFTFLLGGGFIEIFCAFFGAGIGNFVRKKMLEKNITLFANVCVSVAVACLAYIGLIKLAMQIFTLPKIHQAGYICSMLFIIPGFPLITGGIDLAKLDIRSGLERIMYSLLIIFVATVTGFFVAFCFDFAPSDFAVYKLSPILMIIFRLAASFIAVYGFSLMYNSSKKMAFIAALIGMITNVFRLELLDFTNIPAPIAAFFASLCSGLLASAIKKHTGIPRLTITVPSIVIMIPGMFMYKGVYFFATEDFSSGLYWLSKAIMVVCSLSLGLIFARILTDKNFRKSS